MLISKNPKVKGKILFHAKLINKSYRNRGSVARAQIQKNTKKTVKKIAKKLVGLGLRITVDLNILKKKILAYSAIKIIANPPDPYSILNPETSSDSPSEKSNGVRLVSAKHEINQNRATTGQIINIQENWELLRS